MSVTVRAAAKVNLHLGVGAPRADGFHPLVTVYQAVALYDDLTISAAAATALSVEVPSWIASDAVPIEGNIATLAVSRLAPAAAPHAMHIVKGIPVAGGMAGGSADAAAALVAYDRFADLNTPDQVLLRVAADLGSDVPFALIGGTALGTGRGERVTRVPDEATWSWVVVPSRGGLSTPEVYRRFDVLTPAAPAAPAPADRLLAALATGDAERLAAALHNDLQAAALDLRPDLASVLADGEAAGALRGIVSGSGPTCVFLARSPGHAREVATALGARHEVVLVAHGPVAGAHVVTHG